MNPVEEFLELQKQANWLGDFGRALVGHGPGQGGSASTAAQLFQAPLAAAAIAGTGLGISKGVGAIREHFGKARDFQRMVEENPSLQKEDARHVQMLYNSLRRLSPTMAKDPLLAGSFVRDSIRFGPEGGPAVAPSTAKMLADTEKGVAGAGKRHPILDLLGGVGRIMPPQQKHELPPQLVGHIETRRNLPGRSGTISAKQNVYDPAEWNRMSAAAAGVAGQTNP